MILNACSCTSAQFFHYIFQSMKELRMFSENLNVSFCKLLAFMYDIVSQSRPSIHLTIVHQSGGK